MPSTPFPIQWDVEALYVAAIDTRFVCAEAFYGTRTAALSSFVFGDLIFGVQSGPQNKSCSNRKICCPTVEYEKTHSKCKKCLIDSAFMLQNPRNLERLAGFNGGGFSHSSVMAVFCVPGVCPEQWTAMQKVLIASGEREICEVTIIAYLSGLCTPFAPGQSTA